MRLLLRKTPSPPPPTQRSSARKLFVKAVNQLSEGLEPGFEPYQSDYEDLVISIEYLLPFATDPYETKVLRDLANDIRTIISCWHDYGFNYISEMKCHRNCHAMVTLISISTNIS